MFPEDLEVNRKTFEGLVEMVPDINLTVQYLGLSDLETIGLRNAKGVTFCTSKPDQSIDEIEKADLVISNGTIAYQAIALGKPTIMMNQLTPTREPHIKTHERLEAATSHKYELYMRFPFDVSNGSLKSVMRDACKREPKQWRKRFIGEPFDAFHFGELMASLIEEE